MSFVTGTEPAGFGCSVSRTGRTLGRRSLYTSLLPSESSSGCERSSGLETTAGVRGRSAVPEDYDALHSDELLRLYLEEPESHRFGHASGERLADRLRDHICSLKERTLALLTSCKNREAGQRMCTYGPGKHTGERDTPGDRVSPQCEGERKNSLLSSGAHDARTTSRRLWKRLVVGNWNGAFLFLPLCAAGVFLFALALLWLHEESGEEDVPGAPVVLKAARNAEDDDSIEVTQQSLLQWTQHSEQHPNHGRHREERLTQDERRDPVPALRTTGMIRDNIESQGGGPTLVDYMASAASELLHSLTLALARHQGKFPLVEPGGRETITPLQTDVVIRDFMNSQYVIELGVGTPLQTIRAIADTGSSDFWACSAKCGVFCMLHKVYRHSKSSTYTPDNSVYNITYVSGPVSGFLSVDDVHVGDLAAQHVLFAEADNVKGLGASFFFGHFDGVLGMGLPATATHGLKPMMQIVTEQKLLRKWVFSFYLSSDDSVDGELTLGGYDSNRIDGPIVYTPLVDQRYWMINSQGLRVKDDVISKTTRVIIDSGTSLIAGPLDEVDTIARMFGAFTVPMLPKGTYLIACDEALVLQDITLMVEGHKFTIRASDIVIKVSEIKGVPCLFGIIGLEILEGRTSHKAPHPGRMPAAEKQQVDTLQQEAAARQGSLLTRLLAEEALLTGAKYQAQEQRSAEGASSSAVRGPPPEGTPAESAAHGVDLVNGEVREDARLTGVGRLWIFGDVFMRGAYTIFDYDERRIGLAKLKSVSN